MSAVVIDKGLVETQFMIETFTSRSIEAPAVGDCECAQCGQCDCECECWDCKECYSSAEGEPSATTSSEQRRTSGRDCDTNCVPDECVDCKDADASVVTYTSRAVGVATSEGDCECAQCGQCCDCECRECRECECGG